MQARIAAHRQFLHHRSVTTTHFIDRDATMAAAKKGKAAKSDTIVGTVRLGGKTFVEGDEDALAELEESMGVKADRAFEPSKVFGVDSTEPRSQRKPRGPEQRSAALARQNDKNKVNAEELMTTSVDSLADAIKDVNDVGALKRLLKRDERVTAKPIYEARIEAIQAEKDAAGDDDE